MTRSEKIGYAIIAAAFVAVMAVVFTSRANAHIYGGHGKGQVYADASLMPHAEHGRVIFKDCPYVPDAAGCTWAGGPMYVSPDQSYQQRRLTFWHELGHQTDYQRLDAGERATIKTALGYGPVDNWLRGFPRVRTLERDVHPPPGEVYAEAYAVCSWTRVLPTEMPILAYGYHPTQATHEAICPLLAGAAR